MLAVVRSYSQKCDFAAADVIKCLVLGSHIQMQLSTLRACHSSYAIARNHMAQSPPLLLLLLLLLMTVSTCRIAVAAAAARHG